MDDIPHLLDEKEKLTLEIWFSNNQRAKEEVVNGINEKGIAITHRYLKRYFEFPFTEEALRRYAIKKGWSKVGN